jgi:hypothetical protein
VSARTALLVPGAIVVGCGLIGLGLFMGLRQRPLGQVHAAASGAEQSAMPEAVSSGGKPPGVPVTGSTPGVAPTGSLTAEAQAALDREKPRIAAKCWTPPGPTEPRSILLSYDVTFGLDGRPVIVAIGEQRESFRADVAACVRALPTSYLVVSPPQVTTRVLVDLRLP